MDLDVHELYRDLEELKAQRAAVEQERLEVQGKLEELDKILHRVVKLEAIYEHCLSALVGKEDEPQPTRPFALEPTQPRMGSRTPKLGPNAGKMGPRPMKSGTIKHDCYLVLKEQHAFLSAREIYEQLAAKGKRFNYPRPIEMVASVLRASLMRQQGIFVKNRQGQFGLAEWKEKRDESDNSELNGLTGRNGSDTIGC
jgi:FtsZ-binding cell division protein ZapB